MSLKRPRRRPDDLPDDLRERLEHGYVLLNSMWNLVPDAEFETRWRAHRDEILRDWIRERPGSRPWGFWFFECGLDRAPADELGFLAERRLLARGERRRAGVRS